MAPRHDRNAPHSRIQGVPPPAAILGKSPIKPRETSAKQISDVRQIARGGWPTSSSSDLNHLWIMNAIKPGISRRFLKVQTMNQTIMEKRGRLVECNSLIQITLQWSTSFFQMQGPYLIHATPDFNSSLRLSRWYLIDSP